MGICHAHLLVSEEGKPQKKLIDQEKLLQAKSRDQRKSIHAAIMAKKKELDAGGKTPEEKRDVLMALEKKLTKADEMDRIAARKRAAKVRGMVYKKNKELKGIYKPKDEAERT